MSRRHLLLSASALAATTLAALALLPVPAATQTQDNNKAVSYTHLTLPTTPYV